MAGNLGWVPDHHLGVLAEFAHVDELIGELGALLLEYHTTGGDVVRLKDEVKGECRLLVVEGVKPLPPKIPLLVADVLNGLRSALEHTIYAEAFHGCDGEPPEAEARLVEMPARESEQGFADWTKRRTEKGPKALGAGQPLNQRVYDLQPLHMRGRPRAHPMSRLAGYANHAKHRTPVVTAVAVPLVIREDTAPMDPRLLPRRPFERLEAGEVLYSAPAGEVVPLSIVPSVGIRHPRSGAWFVLAREIAAIADWVRKAAVPHLIAGRSQASNPLPAWFNTAVSVKDLRAAAASGEFVPAHEHAQLRLQARVARHQLPGLLARMPGGPSFGAAEAWLASLADAEVTRRLGGFILGPLGEPDAVAKIWKVLEKMRDDALCFSRTGTD